MLQDRTFKGPWVPLNSDSAKRAPQGLLDRKLQLWGSTWKESVAFELVGVAVEDLEDMESLW